MFFSSMYGKCSKCGILCDDFAYDPETQTVLCFDCCQEEAKKDEDQVVVMGIVLMIVFSAVKSIVFRVEHGEKLNSYDELVLKLLLCNYGEK